METCEAKVLGLNSPPEVLVRMWKQLDANSLISWKTEMHKVKQTNKLEFHPISQRGKHRKNEANKISHDEIIMQSDNCLRQRVKGRDYSKLTQGGLIKTKTNRKTLQQICLACGWGLPHQLLQLRHHWHFDLYSSKGWREGASECTVAGLSS